MSGYSDSLTLLATVMWWPALEHIRQFPLDNSQNFFSAITSSPAPLPMHASERDKISSYGLSRLGQSVFFTACWVPQTSIRADGADAVMVHNPFTGTEIILKVHRHSRNVPVERNLSPWRLAQEGRIRISPFPVLEWVRSVSCASPHPALLTLCSVFYEKYWDLFWEGCYDYLCRLARQRCYSAASECCLPVAAVDHYSLLLTGEPGSGKRALLGYFSYRIPHLIRVTFDFQYEEKFIDYVVERRFIDLADVLCRDEEEAVQIIQTTLRLPLYDGRGSLRPVLLLYLCNLDLVLHSLGNSLVDIVSYQLKAALDELSVRQLGVVVCSTSQDPSLAVRPLHYRLTKERIYLTHPTSSERLACLRSKVQALCPTPLEGGENLVFELRSKYSLDEDRWEKLLESLSENFVNLSAPALIGLTRIELLEALQSLLSKSVHNDMKMGTQLGAYKGLFNMDAAIAKLEELAVWPLMHLKALRDLRIRCTKGVLVCGPSGSGKTALLSALCRRLCGVRGLHVMLINGISLIEKEVGKSEKNIAAIFATARAHSPTALFLDNLDSLAPPRRQKFGETTTATDRTLSTLLTEMDGVCGDAGRVVMLIASAPCPESLDPAVRRPGRLDLHVSLDLLSVELAVNIMVSRLSTFTAKLLRLHLLGPDVEQAVEQWEVEGSEDFINQTQGLRVTKVIAERSQQLFHTRTHNGWHRLSSAVVVAALREVMLSVLESLSTTTSSRLDTIVSSEIVLNRLAQCIEDAFVKLLSSRWSW